MTTDAQPVKARRLRPTARAWGLAIAGAIVIALAELFGVSELRFFGIVLLALPLITLLLRLIARPKIEIDRAVYPTTAAAGDRIRVVAEVRNKSIFGLEATSYMDTVTGTDRKLVAGVLPPVASRLHRREGRRRRRIAYGLTRMRRGISQVGPLFLENVDGLGLTRRVIQVGEPVELEVWPHVHNVDRLDIPALRTGSEADVALGRSGDADDVVTREYRRSDALRRVHWRATARAGELRVRQEEHHAEVVAIVVLDTAPTARTDIDPGFELGVSVVASVLTRLHEIGYDTELLETVTDADPDAPPQDAVNLRTSASESLGRIMRHLMLVQPALQESPEELESLHARAASMGKGPLVFVTRTDRPVAEAAIDLAGYGDPAIAILCGPPSEDDAVVEDFVQAGWQVVRMNSAARDPWGSPRRYGQLGFGVRE
ncbi:DUF58 domain-containing protein [Gulosibacter chungangensis]|uniref:DUF58 domain-containing protein n=1 Tax=Gulosibacter chungangensis TaxID=979746 RepID=A0A7J5B9W5_9MICO|nr:DUF58 domain-containing protein [Gulosibacter chungangensis]KAB1642603.1 DUF58 domain-containing protein [Gulosibacter chungangensis]